MSTLSIDPDIRRELEYLMQGFISPAGTLTLATSGTTTTIPHRGVSSNSCIGLTPYDAGARTEGIPQCVPAKGQFVLTHTATATPRTYRYTVHTPSS